MKQFQQSRQNFQQQKRKQLIEQKMSNYRQKYIDEQKLVLDLQQLQIFQQSNSLDQQLIIIQDINKQILSIQEEDIIQNIIFLIQNNYHKQLIRLFLQNLQNLNLCTEISKSLINIAYYEQINVCFFDCFDDLIYILKQVTDIQILENFLLIILNCAQYTNQDIFEILLLITVKFNKKQKILELIIDIVKQQINSTITPEQTDKAVQIFYQTYNQYFIEPFKIIGKLIDEEKFDDNFDFYNIILQFLQSTDLESILQMLSLIDKLCFKDKYSKSNNVIYKFLIDFKILELQLQIFVSEQYLIRYIDFINSEDDQLIFKTVHIISNLLFEQSYIQKIIDAKIFPLLINIYKYQDFKFQEECLYCFANPIPNCTFTQLDYFMSLGIPQFLIYDFSQLQLELDLQIFVLKCIIYLIDQRKEDVFQQIQSQPHFKEYLQLQIEQNYNEDVVQLSEEILDKI